MGIAISRLVSRIIGQYDHNYNGQIDLQKPQREVERRETIHRPDYIQLSTWSRRKLFEAADADGDGKVTADELTAKIKEFDTDGDGELSTRGWFWNPKKEYDHFDDAYGEDLVSQVNFPIHNPPYPPIPPHYA